MMRRRFMSALAVLALCSTLAVSAGATTVNEQGAQPGQGGTGPLPWNRTTRVAVTGDATVEAQPDTAVVSIAVVTQNREASEAQAENASKTEAVVRAVRAAAGEGAEVKTSGYSLQPQYVYRENQAPLISGYVARNGVTVTTGELARVGALVDAASRAGANTIDGISFTLRKDRPAHDEALRQATREALEKARVMAQALGGRVVRVAEVQEVSAVRPFPVMQKDFEMMRGAVAGAVAQATPVEPGTLSVTAQVQLVAEVETQ